MDVKLVDRSAVLVRLYQEDGLTIREIGAIFDITRERVRQLLSQEIGGPIVDHIDRTVVGRTRKAWIFEHADELHEPLCRGEVFSSLWPS